MCRCCQACWEDFVWNCFEEKFCYDESIANYNPEEEEYYRAAMKNGNTLGRLHFSDDNNNLLMVPPPICNQPLRRHLSINGNAKIHEEDYRRETQANVPMLGPEILAVFANSQIFQDHQPTKLSRISTKTLLAGVHTSHRELPTSQRESNEDRSARRPEGNQADDATDSSKQSGEITPTNIDFPLADKRITFTLTTDSSPEGSQIMTPKQFDVIAEEDDSRESGEVLLRPRLIDRRSHLLPLANNTPKKQLRSSRSTPHFSVRSIASETDIFSITGSGQISMTPEVPSISYSNLPKNYEDTPTIEKYRVSQSLYSIQAANANKAGREDYSMPRYFRRSAMLTQSHEVLTASKTSSPSSAASGEEVCRPEKEKSKRLQMLRGALPPLLIHSVSFRKNRDEAKQMD